MTRLKALELFGFKSFADRTRFEFPDGITVVVGPNGSGKSNVVDAIKWVLGEQSVRSLRGKEMTDVIFAGSTSRKPLNAAEVALIFDNSARKLPVASSEVQIMRRVYRSGESEYLVNGEPSRLRDIRELFSGTGAATEAYSVIEQGRVDALLVASGKDRRAVFEEAAGITKFRARRAESLRRLERAEQNRQRLADIVGEVARRLETVRHQAAKARRWRLMTDRLRALRIAAARQDLAEVDAAVEAVELALAATRTAAGRMDAQATEAAEETGALASRAESLEPGIAAARAAMAAGTQRAAAADATLGLHRGRRSEIEADVSRAEEHLATARHSERDAEAAGHAARAAANALERQLAQLAERLRECEQAAHGSHHDAAAARQRLAAAAAVVDERRREGLRLESEHERAEARAAEARRSADAARAALDAARLQAARLEESHAACEGNLGSLAAAMETAERELETLEAALREKTEAVDSAWHELAGWKSKLEACRERRGMLREIVAKQEGISDAARRLLAANAGVPGLAGVLADIIQASVEWAPLVDLALGGLAQSLVVDSLDDVVAWLAGWEATASAEEILAAGGRISLLAASALREQDIFAAPTHPGIVGRLDRLVAASTETDASRPTHDLAAALLARLLGRVWVVERIEHALPLLAAVPADTLFMTRDGRCLSAAGTFEFGTPAAATGLVARRSELRALDQRHDELDRTVAAAAATIDDLQAEIGRLRSAIRQSQGRRQQAAETIATSRADLERVGRERRAVAESIASGERRLRTADQQAAEAVAATHAAAEAAADAATHVESAEAETRLAQSAIETLERSRGAVIDEIQQLRIGQAADLERLARSRDAVAAGVASLAARRADVAEAVSRLQAAATRAGAYELDLLAAESAQAEAVAEEERAAAMLAAAIDEAGSVDARRRAAATTLEESRAAAARLAAELHGHELAAGEARHRRARIIERIRDEYDIAIDSLASDPVGAEDEPVEIPAARADLDGEIEELRRKLAAMTSVNMEALAESEELAARLATLEGQLADVSGAKESIEQLIAKIDEESRRLLGETIETVRGHFRELFERVFGGGQADIVLEPGVDLLETSVEIMARPPGKEPRSISLLSGGEKTMTCVALLLAIFRSRPSPFCVLDEVDAALDEANVDRFVGVLRDFLASTQCIVVTHSKKTMAAATTLYGVTMEESGVSKRVSVRFEATAAAAVRPAAKAA
jgi:chromosome segregation protein